MNNKSGKDSGNKNGYKRKESGAPDQVFGGPKKSGFRKQESDRSFSDRPASGDGDSDNIWKRASKSGGNRKPFAKKEGEGDTDNIWKREGKGGGRNKSFSGGDDNRGGKKKAYTDRNNEVGGNKKRYNSGDSVKRSFSKREDDGTDNNWKRDDGDGKRPFPKREPGSEGNWQKGDADGKKPFPKKERSTGSFGDKKPFAKKDGERKPFAKRDGDKPYGRKPNREEDNTWKKDTTDGEKKPFAKKDTEKTEGRWAKGIDYSDRGMPKKGGEKRLIKESDKPFFQRETPKVEEEKDPIFETPDFEGYEINDEILEEKRKNRKPPVKKEDPSRAFKKGTNEPISSRYGDKPKPRSADEENRTPKKRTEKNDEKRPFKGANVKPFDRKSKPPVTNNVGEDAPKKRRRNDDDDYDEEEIDKGPEAMPLNKYLAHSGVCSRRDAADLVREGKVKLNDVVVTDPGHKVGPDDVVKFNEKKLTIQKGMVYILLNKPKDYITTNEDPQGRKTVMDLLNGADAERLFPVGRLDRNTSGLLLITNDGDLTQKLAHPSFKVKKIYQVTLDKPVTKADFDKILNGLDLEDGKATVDALAYLETKSEIGIEIHIGRNRIVRRIFESLGYEVVKLDRVMYGGLTKKNLPRGKWRYLNEREIVLLKHFKS